MSSIGIYNIGENAGKFYFRHGPVLKNVEYNTEILSVLWPSHHSFTRSATVSSQRSKFTPVPRPNTTNHDPFILSPRNAQTSLGTQKDDSTVMTAHWLLSPVMRSRTTATGLLTQLAYMCFCPTRTCAVFLCGDHLLECLQVVPVVFGVYRRQTWSNHDSLRL